MQLSVIGKHSRDDQGNPLFSDITLGSNELGMIDEFLKTGLARLANEIRNFVSAATSTNEIKFTPLVDCNANLATSIQQSGEDYLVHYCLYSWFTVTAPRISDKYLSDAQADLTALIQQAFYRKKTSVEGLQPFIVEST